MEKLYNNIILDDDFSKEPSDANHIPYLNNPPEVIDVSVGRQLFVDNFLVENTELCPEYHKAVKHQGNPVLKPEMPWEIEQSPVACPKSGGVWYDEEDKIFKMWYEGGWLRNMCYAESKDGLEWVRPNLDFEPGTNKILTYEGYEPEKFFDGVNYLRPDSTTVFIDYDCPREEKYKLFLRNPGGEHSGIVAVSGDGINFHDFRYSGDCGDRSTIFYNPFRKKWVYSIRSIWKKRFGTPWIDRSRNYRECDNYLSEAMWKKEDVSQWMACDFDDISNPYLNNVPQLYNVDCVGYESIMLGMFQIFYGPENGECESRGIPKITELIPMYSRDGYNFSRPCRKSIINSSIYDGAWDRGYVQSVGGVTIIKGDELWIYYTGFAGDEDYRLQSWITNGMYRNGATGLAKLRRDGFVSLNGTGTILTKKLTFLGKSEFYVNVNGTIYAEIYDADGRFIAKSSKFCGDSTCAKLSFDNFDVKLLNGKVFRIKFYLNGKLYSFGFSDENGDFGGAHAAGVCV